MRQGLSVGPLCALVNNNSRCYDDATEFADHLADTLADELKVRQNVPNELSFVFSTRAPDACRWGS